MSKYLINSWFSCYCSPPRRALAGSSLIMAYKRLCYNYIPMNYPYIVTRGEKFRVLEANEHLRRKRYECVIY